MTNSSHCDNDVLSTYTGPANLTANWQGNPITVTWYNDDTQYASNSCTYGGNLTMPSSIPQKTGYTFKGWRVRSNGNQQQCNLANLNTSNWGTTSSNYDTWSVSFSNGTVSGSAMCEESSVNIDPIEYGCFFGDDMTEAAICKCKLTSYTPSGGSECSFASSDWVQVEMYQLDPMGGNFYVYDGACYWSSDWAGSGPIGVCDQQCADACALAVAIDDLALRESIFNAAAQ